MGTYEEIEEDAWTLASVRSTNPVSNVKMPKEKKLVFKAVQGRKFNKDDIDEFLKTGIVGENSNGLLEIRDRAKMNSDADLKNRVTKIIENENNYRKVIMDRVIILNEQASKAGAGAVAKVFAKINQDNAPAGSYIQVEKGRWIKK